MRIAIRGLTTTSGTTMPIVQTFTPIHLGPTNTPGPHRVYSPTRRPNTTAGTSGRLHGFTLVELLIAIAVLALLVRIAFPAYQAYMKRVYRSEAQSLMLDLANREQQYLLDNRSFLGGGASAVSTLVPTGIPADVTAYYTVTITAAAGPPPTFLITATPNSGTPMAGEAAFTLDQDGTKLPAGKWEGR